MISTSNPASAVPPRLGQLDICRGLAILAVLFIHVSGHFLPVLHSAKSLTPPGWAWDALAVPNQGFQWAVPCFLMLSALVNAQSLARGGDVPKYARRRAQMALLPYLLWSGVYMVVDYFLGALHPLSAGHIAKLLLTGTAYFHLYFFVLVLEMYALLPLLVPVFQRRPPLRLVALLAVLLQLVVYYLNRDIAVHRFQATIFWDTLPVALGLWLFSQSSNMATLLQRKGCWVAGLVTITALLVYEPLALATLRQPTNAMLGIWQPIYSFAYQIGQWGYTAGMSFLALALAFALRRNSFTRLLAYLGGESLALYVMHPLAILAMDRLGVNHHFGAGLGLILYYAACLALPLAAVWAWQWGKANLTKPPTPLIIIG